MPSPNDRFHLLLLAFAVFFACVHGPAVRDGGGASGTAFAGATAFDGAPPTDHPDGDSSQHLHGAPALVRSTGRVATPDTARVGVPDRRTTAEGRLIAFAETPPPRASA